MQRPTLVLIPILALLAVAGAQNVTVSSGYPYSNLTTSATLNAFFATYIPNSVVLNSTYYNASIGPSRYLLVQTNQSLYSFVIVNTTNKANYGFVFNITLPYDILQPYLFSKFYPSANTLANLTSVMKQYISTSQGTLNDCLTVTGLDNKLCSASQTLISCLQQSCQSVPICSDGIQAFPPPSPFTMGIQNFSVQYQILNLSEHEYLALSTQISPSTISVYLGQMSTLLTTISSEANKIPQNPIFPPPTNLTATQQGNICLNYLSSGSSSGPWFCYDVGLCRYTTFNSTLLSSLQGEINYLLSLPLSNQTITAIVENATQNANKYYQPIVAQAQNAKFMAFLNSSTPGYAALLANMTFVSARYQNYTLVNATAQLTSTYNGVVAAGYTQNLTAASATLSSAVSNAMKVYKKVSGQYLPVYDAAQNNTAKLFVLQLDYRTIPYSISALASEQSQINIMLNRQVNSTELASISSSISSVSSGVQSASPPLTFESAVKSIDGGLVSALVYAQSAPLPVKIASVPTYVALISFLVGIVILVIVYLGTYHRWKSRNKIKFNPRVKRTWTVLFAFIFVLVLIYTWFAYSFASNANSFIPVSSFLSSVSASNTVYLLVNGSAASNNATSLCISSLKSTLNAQHKTVYRQNVTGYSCIGALPAGTNATSCYERIVASGSPTIIFNSNANSSIIYKGIYGTTLYVSGNVTQGRMCLLNTLFKVNG